MPDIWVTSIDFGYPKHKFSTAYEYRSEEQAYRYAVSVLNEQRRSIGRVPLNFEDFSSMTGGRVSLADEFAEYLRFTQALIIQSQAGPDVPMPRVSKLLALAPDELARQAGFNVTVRVKGTGAEPAETLPPAETIADRAKHIHDAFSIGAASERNAHPQAVLHLNAGAAHLLYELARDVDKLRDAVARMGEVASQEMRSAMVGINLTPATMPPEAFYQSMFEDPAALVRDGVILLDSVEDAEIIDSGSVRIVAFNEDGERVEMIFDLRTCKAIKG